MSKGLKKFLIIVIAIIEALGTDAVFYQNQNSNGISIFEAEAGTALICPCRL